MRRPWRDVTIFLMGVFCGCMEMIGLFFYLAWAR